MLILSFCPQKVKKNTLKSCSEFLKSIFSLTAQTALTEEFMFQNVAYWSIVYRTGLKVVLLINNWQQKLIKALFWCSLDSQASVDF